MSASACGCDHGRVSIRVAIDIGGTFTDLVACAASGPAVRAKADTTAAGLDKGVLTALDRSGVDPDQISTLVHGTTVVINAVTERSGVPTALVTTRGFRDVLLIGRANRPDLYNLAYRKPEPFVPRRWCFEVTERLSHLGEVISPLNEQELLAVAAQLARSPVRAVAICFLHAWRDPRHEQRAASVLRRRLPGVAVVASHQVSGEWREYERASTTVLSAYVQPVVTRYLGRLAAALAGPGGGPPAGARGALYAMRSSGGVCSFEQAARTPVTLLESGPAAGVTAAAELGRRMGARHVLTLDIGGTTAKTSAVRDGQVRVNTLHYVGATPAFAGYPVQAPVVDIVEIGAGGGSVARADAAGGLRVGPRSAGADPGPACYGRGGTEPTLTDANLVAGRLDPGYFLGGRMRLYPDAATRALSRLGADLGVDAAVAARGVLRCAIAAMTHALRLVTLRRGHDPRDFAFVAYGGAGPLHAALLARELGIQRTIIPPGPGHFSAFGMLAGGLRADAARTVVGPLQDLPLAPVLRSLAQQATAELGSAADVGLSRYLGLRYRGQEHTIEVPVPDWHPEAHLAEIAAAFERLSLEAYSFRLDAPLEVVSARVAATAPLEPVRWSDDADDASDHGPGAGAPGVAGSRLVDFDAHGGVAEAAVLPRAAVPAGTWLPGPCVVEEPAATSLVLPGQAVTRDQAGNLIIEERR
jgi:N-methylhydantoinase A